MPIRLKTAVGDLLRLHYVSPDGEDKFPGTLDVTVTYGWDDTCNLSIRYEATTDKPTLCNMTNHSYFNLAGCASGSIHDHVLTVEADAVTSVADNTLIPTGGYTPVAGTPFDMRHGLRLGDGLNATHSCPQMTFAGGYDHNFVLRKGEAMGLAARLYDPKSGRVMETLTDQPGVQVYTACGTDIPAARAARITENTAPSAWKPSISPIRRITRSSSARQFCVLAKNTTRRRFTRSARNDPLC